MALNEGACPSMFPWRTSPRKRPPPTVRTMSTTHTKMQGLEESLSEDQEMDEEPASSFCGSCDLPIETMEESLPDSYRSLKEQLQQAGPEITSLSEQTRTLKENLQKLEEEIVKTQAIAALRIHVERAINKITNPRDFKTSFSLQRR